MENRIQELKKYIQSLNDAGVRMTYLYQYVAESLRTTIGEPIQIRRAKAFAHVLDKTEQMVLPYELIAGSMLGMCPVYSNKPTQEEQNKLAEKVIKNYLEKKKNDKNFNEAIQFKKGHVRSFEDDATSKKSRWSLMSRVHHDASIEYAELQNQIARIQELYKENKEIEDYEIGRELERAFKIPYSKEDKAMYNDLPWFLGNHLNLDYAKVLKKGWKKIQMEIQEYNQNTESLEKKEFYQSAEIVVKAAIRFIKRYADRLEECCQNDNVSEERREELQEMAVICRKIAEEPAETFREALQLTWMLHIIANIQGGSALSFGRMDQYLNPYYVKDSQNGEITYDEAKTLLSCLWLKINEPKMRTVQSMTIGGITPDGKDGANEVTRLCLETAKETGMPYPNLGLRINKINPDWLYEAAVETIKSGCGQPMLLNDDVWIANTMKLGYEKQLANDYYNMGCVEIMIPGKQPNWGIAGHIAFPAVLENVMSKWSEHKTPMGTFDEFMKAYFAEMDCMIDKNYQTALDKQKNMKGKSYDPYSSVLIDGCLENGKDMFQGGSECPTHWCFYAYGIGTAADSLCAVKKFVFEDKRITLSQMNDLLEHNFEGHEELRTMLEQKTPAYGNGIKEVDAIADDVLAHCSKTVWELNKDSGNDKFVSTYFGYFLHIYQGEIAKASPNGRLKGEAFSDSMGPSQGKDIKGPTRLLNSVIYLNDDYVTGGYALSFKVSPAILNDGKGQQAVIDLLKTYIENGGPQIQVYTTNLEDMKDAQIHPEKHRDLIVRVGGYCEFFVNLDKVLQNEIIQRTMYEMA